MKNVSFIINMNPHNKAYDVIHNKMENSAKGDVYLELFDVLEGIIYAQITVPLVHELSNVIKQGLTMSKI